MKCAKCSSEKLKKYEYMGVPCYVCSKCRYDSSIDLESVPESRNSQKAKGRYSPYKSRIKQ